MQRNTLLLNDSNQILENENQLLLTTNSKFITAEEISHFFEINGVRESFIHELLTLNIENNNIENIKIIFDCIPEKSSININILHLIAFSHLEHTMKADLICWLEKDNRYARFTKTTFNHIKAAKGEKNEDREFSNLKEDCDSSSITPYVYWVTVGSKNLSKKLELNINDLINNNPSILTLPAEALSHIQENNLAKKIALPSLSHDIEKINFSMLKFLYLRNKKLAGIRISTIKPETIIENDIYTVNFVLYAAKSNEEEFLYLVKNDFSYLQPNMSDLTNRQEPLYVSLYHIKAFSILRTFTLTKSESLTRSLLLETLNALETNLTERELLNTCIAVLAFYPNQPITFDEYPLAFFLAKNYFNILLHLRTRNDKLSSLASSYEKYNGSICEYTMHEIISTLTKEKLTEADRQTNEYKIQFIITLSKESGKNIDYIFKKSLTINNSSSVEFSDHPTITQIKNRFEKMLSLNHEIEKKTPGMYKVNTSENPQEQYEELFNAIILKYPNISETLSNFPFDKISDNGAAIFVDLCLKFSDYESLKFVLDRFSPGKLLNIKFFFRLACANNNLPAKLEFLNWLSENKQLLRKIDPKLTKKHVLAVKGEYSFQNRPSHANEDNDSVPCTPFMYALLSGQKYNPGVKLFANIKEIVEENPCALTFPKYFFLSITEDKPEKILLRKTLALAPNFKIETLIHLFDRNINIDINSESGIENDILDEEFIYHLVKWNNDSQSLITYFINKIFSNYPDKIIFLNTIIKESNKPLFHFLILNKHFKLLINLIQRNKELTPQELFVINIFKIFEDRNINIDIAKIKIQVEFDNWIQQFPNDVIDLSLYGIGTFLLQHSNQLLLEILKRNKKNIILDVNHIHVQFDDILDAEFVYHLFRPYLYKNITLEIESQITERVAIVNELIIKYPHRRVDVHAIIGPDSLSLFNALYSIKIESKNLFFTGNEKQELRFSQFSEALFPDNRKKVKPVRNLNKEKKEITVKATSPLPKKSILPASEPRVSQLFIKEYFTKKILAAASENKVELIQAIFQELCKKPDAENIHLNFLELCVFSQLTNTNKNILINWLAKEDGGILRYKRFNSKLSAAHMNAALGKEIPHTALFGIHDNNGYSPSVYAVASGYEQNKNYNLTLSLSIFIKLHPTILEKSFHFFEKFKESEPEDPINLSQIFSKNSFHITWLPYLYNRNKRIIKQKNISGTQNLAYNDLNLSYDLINRLCLEFKFSIIIDILNDFPGKKIENKNGLNYNLNLYLYIFNSPLSNENKFLLIRRLLPTQSAKNEVKLLELILSSLLNNKDDNLILEKKLMTAIFVDWLNKDNTSLIDLNYHPISTVLIRKFPSILIELYYRNKQILSNIPLVKQPNQTPLLSAEFIFQFFSRFLEGSATVTKPKYVIFFNHLLEDLPDNFDTTSFLTTKVGFPPKELLNFLKENKLDDVINVLDRKKSTNKSNKDSYPILTSKKLSSQNVICTLKNALANGDLAALETFAEDWDKYKAYVPNFHILNYLMQIPIKKTIKHNVLEYFLTENNSKKPKFAIFDPTLTANHINAALGNLDNSFPLLDLNTQDSTGNIPLTYALQYGTSLNDKYRPQLSLPKLLKNHAELLDWNSNLISKINDQEPNIKINLLELIKVSINIEQECIKYLYERNRKIGIANHELPSQIIENNLLNPVIINELIYEGSFDLAAQILIDFFNQLDTLNGIQLPEDFYSYLLEKKHIELYSTLKFKDINPAESFILNCIVHAIKNNQSENNLQEEIQKILIKMKINPHIDIKISKIDLLLENFFPNIKNFLQNYTKPELELLEEVLRKFETIKVKYYLDIQENKNLVIKLQCSDIELLRRLKIILKPISEKGIVQGPAPLKSHDINNIKTFELTLPYSSSATAKHALVDNIAFTNACNNYINTEFFRLTQGPTHKQEFIPKENFKSEIERGITVLFCYIKGLKINWATSTSLSIVLPSADNDSYILEIPKIAHNKTIIGNLSREFIDNQILSRIKKLSGITVSTLNGEIQLTFTKDAEKICPDDFDKNHKEIYEKISTRNLPTLPTTTFSFKNPKPKSIEEKKTPFILNEEIARQFFAKLTLLCEDIFNYERNFDFLHENVKLGNRTQLELTYDIKKRDTIGPIQPASFFKAIIETFNTENNKLFAFFTDKKVLNKDGPALATLVIYRNRLNKNNNPFVLLSKNKKQLSKTEKVKLNDIKIKLTAEIKKRKDAKDEKEDKLRSGFFSLKDKQVIKIKHHLSILAQSKSLKIIFNQIGHIDLYYVLQIIHGFEICKLLRKGSGNENRLFSLLRNLTRHDYHVAFNESWQNSLEKFLEEIESILKISTPVTSLFKSNLKFFIISPTQLSFLHELNEEHGDNARKHKLGDNALNIKNILIPLLVIIQNIKKNPIDGVSDKIIRDIEIGLHNFLGELDARKGNYNTVSYNIYSKLHFAYENQAWDSIADEIDDLYLKDKALKMANK